MLAKLLSVLERPAGMFLALGLLCLAAGAEAAAPWQHVKAKPGAVKKDGRIDYDDCEQAGADHVQVIAGGDVMFLIKTFLPPGGASFLPFPETTTHVDIWANPDGLGFDRLVDTPRKIKVRGTFLTATHAGNFPLRAEGNIGGPGSGGPVHWSAMVDHVRVELQWSEAGEDAQGEEEGGGGRADAVVSASFTEDSRSVTCTSTKDLSNVVLSFTDGTEQKFDGLSGHRATFAGTGEHLGKLIAGVWIKSGRNASGEGPGFGQYVANARLLDDDEPAADAVGELDPANQRRAERIKDWGDARLGLLDPNRVVGGKHYFGGVMELQGTLRPYPLQAPVERGDFDFKRVKNERVVLIVPGRQPRDLVRDLGNAFPKANDDATDDDEDLRPDDDGRIFVYAAPAFAFPAGKASEGWRLVVRASFVEWVECKGAVVSDKFHWHLERTVEFDGEQWLPVGRRNRIQPGRIRDFGIE